MSTQTLQADYLIIGSGAVGMAFADVILKETDASIVMVDSHHRPGGHWNDAYPFVRLHGPSSLYGVSSRRLGSGTKDTTGLNKGLDDLHFKKFSSYRLRNRKKERSIRRKNLF